MVQIGGLCFFCEYRCLGIAKTRPCAPDEYSTIMYPPKPYSIYIGPLG